MHKQRYVVADHHVNDEATSRPDFHHLVGGYHWVRLDSEHIFGMVYARETGLQHLNAHPKVSVLPSLHANKSVHQHLKDKGKHKHLDALKNHGTVDIHTTHDVAVHLAEKFVFNALHPDL